MRDGQRTMRLSYPVVLSSDHGAVPISGTVTVASVSGNVASGAADSGNPIKFGGVLNTTRPTFTNGQRGDAQIDTRGNLAVTVMGFGNTSGASVTSPADAAAGTAGLSIWAQGAVFNGTNWDRLRGDLNGIVTQPALSSTFWNYAALTGGITNTSDVAVKASAGATTRNYVSTIQFLNSAAVASEIVIKDGASTVMWRGRASATMLNMQEVKFDPPLRGSVNSAVNVQLVTTGTATLVNVQGWTGP